jgi:hypothetical protein
MTTSALTLELTTSELDMMFVLFQTARQDKYTFDEINTLMRKIQLQGRPQLEALAVKTETPPPAPKVRKPREPKAAPVAEMRQVAAGHTVADVPDLSDLKLD